MSEKATRKQVERQFKELIEEIGGVVFPANLYELKQKGGMYTGYCLDFDRSLGWAVRAGLATEHGQRSSVFLDMQGPFNSGRRRIGEFLAVLEFATNLERHRKLVAERDIRYREYLMRPIRREEYAPGARFVVAREWCWLDGMQPAGRGAFTGWRRDLHIGDVIEVATIGMTFGDGVPAIKWGDENGEWLASDCTFRPVQGGMWGGQVPADGCLQRYPRRG